ETLHEKFLRFLRFLHLRRIGMGKREDVTGTISS
ncbi:MAG: hypothetical protein FD153_1220, partial [Rhodospirillaceae bacterium]